MSRKRERSGMTEVARRPARLGGGVYTARFGVYKVLIQTVQQVSWGRNDMRTLVATVLIIAIAASNALATAQYPDKILYDGKEYSLHTNPMELYFIKHPEKKPKREIISTALWRGYVATFEVKDKSPVLKDIEIDVPRETEDGKSDCTWKSVKDTVVPKGKVLQIDWFTGILVLPYGKLVRYVHMGYGSTYSNYILLEIEGGKLTGERKLDYKQYAHFKEKQFQAFKKTEEYRKRVARLQKEGHSQELIDSFLRMFLVDYTSKFLDEEAPNKAIDGDKK